MSADSAASDAKDHTHPTSERNLYLTVTWLLQVTLVIGLVLFVIRRDWENVFLTFIVIAVTLVPALLSRRFRVIVPPEFELISALFVFLSLFLGSAFDWYYKYWWWDIVLHASSGFLLGIIGFIVLFVMNQAERLPAGMKPSFLCLFGVTFAVTLGVIWEIYEFIMDQIWPSLNMQTNETGVRDTMMDLIVDLFGAVIVGVMGYAYLKTGRYSFIADGVRTFVAKNPRLMGMGKASKAHGEER